MLRFTLDSAKAFSHLLFDEHLSVARRVFMTATERRYAGQGDAILSMDDPIIYGISICTLTEAGGIALAKSNASTLSSKLNRSVISGFTSILPEAIIATARG